MNKKLIALGLVGTIGMAGAIAIPLVVSANTDVATTATSSVNSFVQKLAAQLGLDQSVVQTAVTAVQTNIKAERDAAEATKITDAITAGTITQRQADILTAMQSVQLSAPTQPKTDLSTLTETERQAQMTAERTAREQELVDALNTKGLNTTLTEVQAAQTAARTANLRVGGMGRGGFGGMGHGGEMGHGDMGIMGL